MKKLLLFVLSLSIVYTTFSQTPKSTRLVLVEEFTNASCGPCASQNPAFNTLLQANPTKVVPLKYQWYYPGYDPMNAQNPTEADNRIDYYGFSGVPTGIVDGVAIPDDCSGYVGCPTCLNQAEIDVAAGISSPFNMNLSYTFSPDYDSIFIHLSITATEALSVSGPLKAQVAITENHISFCVAPGANGEKDFYNVMRKMLPNDQGTTLPNSWTLGQNQVIDFAVALPTYIYDISEVAVVAFIQDDATKLVKQAAFAPPQPIALDAGLACNPIANIDALNCQQNLTPSVTIKNFRSTTITSAVIKYRIDSNTDELQNWSGTLAPGATQTVTLPVITVPYGTHTLTVSVNDPNGAVDFHPGNNSASLVFNVIGTYFPMPVTESFTSTTFPPDNWIKEDIDFDNYGWSRKTGAGGFGNSTSCAKIDFWNSPSGNIDNLYTPPMNFSGTSSAYLSFSYAYAQYNSSSDDEIKVQVSTNCGQSWSEVWAKKGAALATRAATTSAFTPTATQWASSVVNLASYAGQSNVFIRFRGISDYGNNGYIDDIQIVVNNPTAITETTDNASVLIFPNPFSEYTNINIDLKEKAHVSYKVFNLTGSLVYTEDAGELNPGNHLLRFNRGENSSGIYYLQIATGDNIITEKISIE